VIGIMQVIIITYNTCIVIDNQYNLYEPLICYVAKITMKYSGHRCNS